jgi:chromosome segregation ATPase
MMGMNRIDLTFLRSLFFSAAGLLPLLAHGQIYTCKDAAGHTITGDHPMPECSNSKVLELSKAGVVKREIPAPLTAEQKRQQQALDDKRRVEQAAEEQRRQQDRALLSRYRSEADIEASRRYYLSLSQDLIKRDQVAIDDAQNQLKAANTEAEFYKRRKTLPASLRSKIDDANRDIAYNQKSMADHQAELGRINGKFDETLKHYRELIGAMPEAQVSR